MGDCCSLVETDQDLLWRMILVGEQKAGSRVCNRKTSSPQLGNAREDDLKVLDDLMSPTASLMALQWSNP